MERFVIRTKEDRARCLKAVQAIRQQPLIEVIIKQYKSNRSEAQNNYLWGLVYPMIKIHVYENRNIEYSKDEIHAWAKNEFASSEPKFVFGKFVVCDSTKNMNTKEFMDYVTKIQAYFAEQGLYIPDPNEELKNEYKKA